MSLKEFVNTHKDVFGFWEDEPVKFGWLVTGKDGQVFQNNYPKDDGDREDLVTR